MSFPLHVLKIMISSSSLLSYVWWRVVLSKSSQAFQNGRDFLHLIMWALGALEALGTHWFRVEAGSKAMVVRKVVPCLSAYLDRHFGVNLLRLELLKGATPLF